MNETQEIVVEENAEAAHPLAKAAFLEAQPTVLIEALKSYLAGGSFPSKKQIKEAAAALKPLLTLTGDLRGRDSGINKLLAIPDDPSFVASDGTKHYKFLYAEASQLPAFTTRELEQVLDELTLATHNTRNAYHSGPVLPLMVAETLDVAVCAGPSDLRVFAATPPTMPFGALVSLIMATGFKVEGAVALDEAFPRHKPGTALVAAVALVKARIEGLTQGASPLVESTKLHPAQKQLLLHIPGTGDVALTPVAVPALGEYLDERAAQLAAAQKKKVWFQLRYSQGRPIFVEADIALKKMNSGRANRRLRFAGYPPPDIEHAHRFRAVHDEALVTSVWADRVLNKEISRLIGSIRQWRKESMDSSRKQPGTRPSYYLRSPLFGRIAFLTLRAGRIIGRQLKAARDRGIAPREPESLLALWGTSEYAEALGRQLSQSLAQWLARQDFPLDAREESQVFAVITETANGTAWH